MFRGSSISILFIKRLLTKKQIDAIPPMMIAGISPTRQVDELILTRPAN